MWHLELQILLFSISITLYSATVLAQFINHVDPLIGTEGPVTGTGYNGGNIFPGAAVPFGMVKIGPDVTTDVRTVYLNRASARIIAI